MKWEFDTQKFGETVRFWRKDAGQRVNAAAKEIGVSGGSLSRIEQGLTVEIETFTKICTWLQIEPGEFFKQVEG